MTKIHVETKNLCKEYSGRKVLNNVSFSVERGEFLAIVGPNGAGKTTLLRILDLLEEPTSGEVWINGLRVDYARKDKHVLRRSIGFVPQKPVLFDASVFDNVAYGLRVRGLSAHEIERRVTDALKMVGLTGLERRNALTLSGGEAQRVSLAQTLITDPQLLLLDEPTSNLDPKSTSIIEETLSYVGRERGVTIIMASHDILQVENLAKRILMLSDGRVVKIGTFSELFNKPTEEIARYMRLENIFTGLSKTTEEGTSIIEVEGGLRIEAAFKVDGEVTIHIPPESIIILGSRVSSSARNIFKGRITQIADYGSIIKLKVKVESGREFNVQITKKSFEEMSLNIGSEAYIAFKASSVRLI
ncbi:ABC transporter ATP-binding protein [Candidatus Bathyarchaeota archaeon]|nr:ABC transporter ATP-binding protein [Candidatus Bathyarchaeota archaeon]